MPKMYVSVNELILRANEKKMIWQKVQVRCEREPMRCNKPMCIKQK